MTGVESPAIAGAFGSILARWFSFVSIFVVIGVVAFRSLVLRRMNPGGANLFSEIAEVNAATLGIVAGTSALLGGMLRVVRESTDMPDVSMSSMLLDSWWGVSVLIQVVAGLGAAIALFFVHRTSSSGRTRAWQAATVLSVFLAIAPALGGRAVASEPVSVAVIDDVLHVAAGSLWLGTLAAILIVGFPAALKTPDTIRPGERVASMINTFSPVAMSCGAVMVLTGVVSAKFHVPSWQSLWTTPYGVLLLLKLFFVALLFAGGTWNWKRLKPRLTGDDAIPQLRSSATLELVIAAMVIGVTSMLVALEVP